MGIMNEAKRGADLTHPRASVGYMVGAVVAIVILMVLVGVAGYLYRAGKSVVGGGVITAGNQTGMSGVFGDGT